MARVRGPMAGFCACFPVGVGGAGTAGAIGFLGGWGERGSGRGEFGFPVSVAVDPSGTVHVADSENDRAKNG
jgi:NHL repeat